VRFVGEAVAMCVAPTRAEAEDLTEEIEVEFDELPVLVDALAARAEKTVRVHEQWDDNLFLTLNLDNGYDANAKGAPVVVRRELSLNRQAMVPMEGKAILAHWDERSDQLVVYYSTQVPHVVRVGLAQFLGIDQGQVRVISPDVGGGFGYKVIVHPEELCVAWLALKYRRPFRYVEDRREPWWSAPIPASIITGSPRTRINADGCSHSTRKSPSMAALIPTGHSRLPSSRGRRPAICRALTISAATAARRIA
jgi:carbon-monoxide dehydrogenase large subunit